MRRWALAAVATLGFGADADAERDRGLHGSVGAGGSLVLTGAGGDRLRLDVAVDVKPWSRFGVTAAWRAFDDARHGLVMVGVIYEGAAARPRLVLDLHGDVGADLDGRAPLIGGGVRPTLTIVGPLAVVFDVAAYVVIDGVDATRLQLQSTTLLAIRW